ncbi:unnamed protein product [Malus baccata var. baccata]
MDDEETQEIIQARNRGKKKDFRIRETDGMFMQESRMYVPNNMELKKAILDEAHISTYAMHPGGTKMYHTIQPFYYWPDMKREIAEYVCRCVICQQVKADRKKPFGLMQPLPVPQWKWENITMDFVYKLPRTRNGYDGIWVIVDRLTKSAHFIPLREKYSLSRLVELFVSKIVKYHGVLVSIISDRNPRFTSKFWIAFQEALGSRLFYSTTYHPQTDGQLEKAIRTLEDMLRYSDRQKSLADKHAIERVYNVGDWVFLKLSPWTGVVRFGKKGKLSPRVELPPELSKVHNVFHVFMLRHSISDHSHVIPPQPLEINSNLTYDEEPMTILDWKDKVLRNKTVHLVKVLWRNHSVEKVTRETEDQMRDMYPRLFYDY